MDMPKKTIASLMREHKAVFIIIAVVLFLVELEIFAIAAMKSGRKSWLQVFDHNGNLIYETDGKSLSDFNKYYFEKIHGPLENFQVKLTPEEVPFPFRGWFTAAVGIPLGIILLFAFIVKAYYSLFYGDDDQTMLNASSGDQRTQFEKVISGVSHFNIFVIGFFILLAVLLYWILPNFFMYLGRTGLQTFDRYQWVFISIGVVIVGIVMWIIYLKYLLARKTIDSQVELTKFRLQLEMSQSSRQSLQVTYQPDNAVSNPSLTWEQHLSENTVEPKIPPHTTK